MAPGVGHVQYHCEPKCGGALDMLAAPLTSHTLFVSPTICPLTSRPPMYADRLSLQQAGFPAHRRPAAGTAADAQELATSTTNWKKEDGGRLETRSRGVSPTEIIGKVLVRVQRSGTHPAVTFYFADHSIYQVRVDGYDPVHPGVPKEIETDPGFESTVYNGENGRSDLRYTIKNAVFTTLKDRGFHRRNGAEEDWIQGHTAVAFCFEE